MLFHRTCGQSRYLFLLGFGYLLLLQNQSEEAKKLIDQSLAKNPQNSYAHRNLGLYFLKNDQKADALTALQKAYSLDPATDQIHAWLGEALFINNQKNEACRMWQKGQSLGDNKTTEFIKMHCQ